MTAKARLDYKSNRAHDHLADRQAELQLQPAVTFVWLNTGTWPPGRRQAELQPQPAVTFVWLARSLQIHGKRCTSVNSRPWTTKLWVLSLRVISSTCTVQVGSRQTSAGMRTFSLLLISKGFSEVREIFEYAKSSCCGCGRVFSTGQLYFRI